MDTKRINVHGKRREPSKIPSAELSVNCRSLVRTPSYGLGEGHNPLDLLLLRQIRRVDEDRIGGLNGLRRVFRVPMDDRVRLGGDLVLGRVAIETLDEATPRPLPGI